MAAKWRLYRGQVANIKNSPRLAVIWTPLAHHEYFVLFGKTSSGGREVTHAVKFPAKVTLCRSHGKFTALYREGNNGNKRLKFILQLFNNNFKII